MKSYASIDRIEGKFAVCEVEVIEIEDSKTKDYLKKQTVIIDIPIESIKLNVGNIQEGDIIIVEHNEKNVTKIYSKDDEEKQRRINELKRIMEQ